LPDVLTGGRTRLEAVYTHFATADVPESPGFDEPAHRFEQALGTIDELVGTGGHGADHAPRVWRHACNSAALLRDSRVWYDAVRPGLLLYGIVPPPLATTLPLDAGDVADQPRRGREGSAAWRRSGLRLAISDRPARVAIAVVPAGYADGLDTRLCGRGHVLVRGCRAPIVGHVSMDMITVDVTDLGDVQPGDEVVLLGRQGEAPWQQIDAREMAAAIGTIPWEIVCRLGTRIERQYTDGQPPIAGAS
jgi:alanine racemase